MEGTEIVFFGISADLVDLPGGIQTDDLGLHNGGREKKAEKKHPTEEEGQGVAMSFSGHVTQKGKA
ncbi:hypothetical protein ACLG6S_04910 [Thermodesulfobacteriota bacterium B35]